MHANPFSTRFIQPGAIEYQRFDGGTVKELAQQFLELPSKRGSIIGPHGSGKSTLLANLICEFQSLRTNTQIHALRFSTERSPRTALCESMSEWKTESIVVLDGYEQLGFWSRMQINRRASRQGITLLATAHQVIHGFQTLWETSVTETSSHWVVHRLLQQSVRPETATDLLASEAWEISRSRHQQNLRESLFDMYDWYQSRNQAGKT
jgi:ABC-type branched-subunit amino acid transport system ATPase component